MTDKQKREERVAAALERIATTLEGILEIIEQGIDEGAMYYLDRIMKAANRWEEAESSAKSEKDSYERNR